MSEQLPPRCTGAGRSCSIADDDDVYYYMRWRLKLEGKTENMGVCTKERKGVTAAVLMATPCTNSLGGDDDVYYGGESGGLETCTRSENLNRLKYVLILCEAAWQAPLQWTLPVNLGSPCPRWLLQILPRPLLALTARIRV